MNEDNTKVRPDEAELNEAPREEAASKKELDYFGLYSEIVDLIVEHNDIDKLDSIPNIGSIDDVDFKNKTKRFLEGQLYRLQTLLGNDFVQLHNYDKSIGFIENVLTKIEHYSAIDNNKEVLLLAFLSRFLFMYIQLHTDNGFETLHNFFIKNIRNIEYLTGLLSSADAKKLFDLFERINQLHFTPVKIDERIVKKISELKEDKLSERIFKIYQIIMHEHGNNSLISETAITIKEFKFIIEQFKNIIINNIFNDDSKSNIDEYQIEEAYTVYINYLFESHKNIFSLKNGDLKLTLNKEEVESELNNIFRSSLDEDFLQKFYEIYRKKAKDIAGRKFNAILSLIPSNLNNIVLDLNILYEDYVKIKKPNTFIEYKNLMLSEIKKLLSLFNISEVNPDYENYIEQAFNIEANELYNKLIGKKRFVSASELHNFLIQELSGNYLFVQTLREIYLNNISNNDLGLSSKAIEEEKKLDRIHRLDSIQTAVKRTNVKLEYLEMYLYDISLTLTDNENDFLSSLLNNESEKIMLIGENLINSIEKYESHKYYTDYKKFLILELLLQYKKNDLKSSDIDIDKLIQIVKKIKLFFENKVKNKDLENSILSTEIALLLEPNLNKLRDNETNPQIISDKLDDKEITSIEAKLINDNFKYIETYFNLLKKLSRDLPENDQKDFDDKLNLLLSKINKPDWGLNLAEIQKLFNQLMNICAYFYIDDKKRRIVAQAESLIKHHINIIHDLYSKHEFSHKSDLINPDLLKNIDTQNQSALALSVVDFLVNRINKNILQGYTFEVIKGSIFTMFDYMRHGPSISSDKVQAYAEKLDKLKSSMQKTMFEWWNTEIGRRKNRSETVKLSETARRASYVTFHTINENFTDKKQISKTKESLRKSSDVEIFIAFTYSQLKYYIENSTKEKQNIEEPIPISGKYSVIIYREKDGILQAKKIIIDHSDLSDVVSYTQKVKKQLNDNSLWFTVDENKLKESNDNKVNRDTRAIFIGNKESSYDNNYQNYIDPNNLFYAHLVVNFGEKQIKEHPLDDLTLDPYGHNAWGGYNIKKSDQGNLEIIGSHHHSRIDGATAKKSVSDVMVNMMQVLSDVRLETDEDLKNVTIRNSKQVLIKEHAKNRTTIQNIKIDRAFSETGQNFTDLAAELFLKYKNLGIKLNAHNLEQMIIMLALDRNHSHFLEKSGNVLIPVPQIFSEKSLQILNMNTEEINTNPEESLQMFLELVVDMRNNAILRSTTSTLPIVPIISEIAGQANFVLRKLLELSGSITIEQYVAIVNNTILGSNVSNQTEPKNKTNLFIMNEFTTAGSGAYPDASVGIFNDVEGNVVFSFRRDNRSRIKQTDEEIETRFLSATKQIINYFNSIYKIIESNPHLAGLMLKS